MRAFLRLGGEDFRSRQTRRYALAATLCVQLATTACGDDSITNPLEFVQATRVVDAWVAAHPNEWVLHIIGNRFLARPEWSRPCAQSPISGFVTLRAASNGTEIDFHFRCPLDATASVEDLATAFSHVTLYVLPHGIHSPGWRFSVLTPSSSVSEKVAFAAFDRDQLRIVIETPLYGVYGHSERPSCQPLADAPSPEGCYVAREHRIPLRLTMVMPFHASALE